MSGTGEVRGNIREITQTTLFSLVAITAIACVKRELNEQYQILTLYPTTPL